MNWDSAGRCLEAVPGMTKFALCRQIVMLLFPPLASDCTTSRTWTYLWPLCWWPLKVPSTLRQWMAAGEEVKDILPSPESATTDKTGTHFLK